MTKRWGKRATPCITATVKDGGGSVMVWGSFANCKDWDLLKVKGNLNQTGKHSMLSISQSYLERSLWVKDLYSCEIMTHSILVNSVKSEQEQFVLQLRSWPEQSTHLNPIEMVWYELERKVRAIQPRSAAHFWQLLKKSWSELNSVYLQYLVEKMPRICEAVIEGHFDESKVKEFLCFFGGGGGNLNLMCLRKTCV